MPLQGEYRLQRSKGEARAGACRVEWDKETLTLVPSPAGQGDVALDLGEILTFRSTDWDVTLGLLGGGELNLHHFGKATSVLVTELGEAWRERVATCLLIGDMRLVEAFTCQVNGQGRLVQSQEPGHLRLYESNLSFMQSDGAVATLPLARVHAVAFDSQKWEVLLSGTGFEWRVGKLGLRTDMFRRTVEKCVATTRKRCEATLHAALPELPAREVSALVQRWPEGGILSHKELQSFGAAVPSWLMEHGVSEEQRPYVEKLLEVSRGAGLSQGWYAGYKLLGRATEEDSEVASDCLIWFLCPLKSGKSGDLVAWEAASSQGHATYLFRCGSGQLEALNEALVSVQFRREPIYLSAQELQENAQWKRHWIADQRIPHLSFLRGALHGRLIHSDPASWTQALLSS